MTRAEFEKVKSWYGDPKTEDHKPSILRTRINELVDVIENGFKSESTTYGDYPEPKGENPASLCWECGCYGRPNKVTNRVDRNL